MITVRLATRTMLIITPVVVLSLFIWQDLAISGEFTVVTDLRGYNPYISPLYPLGRVSDLESADGVSWRQIMAEPIYFDVRMPRSLHEARLRLVYKENDVPDLKIGLKVGGQGDWLYDFKMLSDVSVANNEEWRVGYIVFNLDEAAIDSNHIRFAVSAPSLKNSTTKLLIKNIEVELRGETMSFSSAIDKGLRKLIKYLPYAG